MNVADAILLMSVTVPRVETVPIRIPVVISLQQVALNVADVILKMSVIVPRVETVLYTGWTAAATACNIRPIILPHLIEACKKSVMCGSCSCVLLYPRLNSSRTMIRMRGHYLILVQLSPFWDYNLAVPQTFGILTQQKYYHLSLVSAYIIYSYKLVCLGVI